MTNYQLATQLIDQGVLKTPALIKAFQTIDRADFVPASHRRLAYTNYPLPIGSNQTISQPYTVAFMLELLQPEPGHNILDIGSGSGWQTALLAQIVGPSGHITALERIPQLACQGRLNVARYQSIDRGTVEVQTQNAQPGYPTRAPFDRIIAAAQVKEIPTLWLDQLTSGGRLVVPQANSLQVLAKQTPDHISQKSYPGFAFVPFIND